MASESPQAPGIGVGERPSSTWPEEVYRWNWGFSPTSGRRS